MLCGRAGGEELFLTTKVEATIAGLGWARRLEGRLEGPGGDLPRGVPRPRQAASWDPLTGRRRGSRGTRTGRDREEWAEASGGYKRMADLRVSTTDPDASPMHQKKKGASRLGYLTHYVVDGGKARVVLNVLVAAAEVYGEPADARAALQRPFRWRLRPRSVTGDAAYGTRENMAAIEEAGIRAYPPRCPIRESAPPLFAIEDFVYDAQKDLYTCPKTRPCAVGAATTGEGTSGTAPSASSCDGCPSRAECTNGPKGRWLSRGLEEEYLERVRAYRDTEPTARL